MLRQPVLVTGASGFIGGQLVRRLIEGHSRVTCLVRVLAHVEALKSAGAQLVTGDVTDRGSVEAAITVSQAGTVFQLAGAVKARRWGNGGRDFMQVNAGGVENVAAACADCAGPPVLVVMSSLAAAGPCAGDPWRVEGDIPAPVSQYGRSKLAGEQAAARYAGDVPISIVRPPIVFGPGDRAMLEMFRPMVRWGLHVVPGWRGRDCRLSLIHVDDLVEGLVLVAEKGERLGAAGVPGQGVYFIAGEDNPTYAQLGQAMARALGQRPLSIRRVPGPLLRLAGICGDVVAQARGQPGWISSDKMAEALAGSWTCSAAKARAHLGWSPRATLMDRLAETVQWYRQAGWLGA